METVRQRLIALLCEEELSALELSGRLRIMEREVFEHLEHIKRSLSAQKKRLIVKPARCLGCGYSFESRNRFTKPGRCPRCKDEHIADPRYRIL